MIKEFWVAATALCLLAGGLAAGEGADVNRGADDEHTGLRPVVWQTVDSNAAPWSLLELE